MMLAEIVWNQNTLAVALIFAIPIIAILAMFWHRTECHRSDNDLKQSMVERGYSADQIEKVLLTQPPKK